MFLVSFGLRHVFGRDQKNIEWGSRYIIYIYMIIYDVYTREDGMGMVIF